MQRDPVLSQVLDIVLQGTCDFHKEMTSNYTEIEARNRLFIKTVFFRETGSFFLHHYVVKF